jgi:hypothetical protein
MPFNCSAVTRMLNKGTDNRRYINITSLAIDNWFLMP